MTLAETINELFLTDGLIAWLGLLVIIMFLFAFIAVKKELVIFGLPVMILMGLMYLNAGLGWHFLLSILSTIFMLFGGILKHK